MGVMKSILRVPVGLNPPVGEIITIPMRGRVIRVETDEVYRNTYAYLEVSEPVMSPENDPGPTTMEEVLQPQRSRRLKEVVVPMLGGAG